MYKFSAIAALASTAQATYRIGSCPSFQAMESFDVNRYVGRWYEIVRDSMTTFELFSECVNVNYDVIEGYNGLVQVHNKNKYPAWGWNDIVGQAIQTIEGGANLNVNFFEPASATKYSNYHVLDTDYDNYTIVYSCSDMFGGWMSADTLWILTREQSIDDSLLASIFDTIGEKLPHYDVVAETHMTYQGDDWCAYNEMPDTPNPQLNPLLDM